MLSNGHFNRTCPHTLSGQHESELGWRYHIPCCILKGYREPRHLETFAVQPLGFGLLAPSPRDGLVAGIGWLGLGRQWFFDSGWYSHHLPSHWVASLSLVAETQFS